MRRTTPPMPRRAWLVPPALAVQIAGIFLLPDGGGAILRRLCLLATTVMLWVVIWSNRGRWGMRAIGLGLLLNTVALFSGLGLMPIAPGTARAAGLGPVIAARHAGDPLPHGKDVLLPKSMTPLWPITDSIAVNLPDRHYAVSPGDLLILTGVLIGIIEAAVCAMPRPRATGLPALAPAK